MNKIQKIGELIRTQDNRCTSDPLFLVQQKKRIYGMDTAYTDDTVWISEEGDEADENESERLDLLEFEGKSDPDWTWMGYIDQWEFVTACFTEKGCQEYIEANSHRLNEPRIYAASMYRNKEMIQVRESLINLPGI